MDKLRIGDLKKHFVLWWDDPPPSRWMVVVAASHRPMKEWDGRVFEVSNVGAAVYSRSLPMPQCSSQRFVLLSSNMVADSMTITKCFNMAWSIEMCRSHRSF